MNELFLVLESIPIHVTIDSSHNFEGLHDHAESGSGMILVSLPKSCHSFIVCHHGSYLIFGGKSWLGSAI